MASEAQLWPDAYQVVRALRSRLPDGLVLSDPAGVDGYRHDRAEWAPAGRPACVVLPETTEQARATVSCCAELGVAVVPRGAGTGLSGGATALGASVVLSTERMRRIVEIDAANQLVVTQPGVVNDELKNAVAVHGLWYPPDPISSPWSTIGGNVATNAGGLSCVKYGVTRDYVLGLQAVVGAGTVVRLGRRTAKGVAGYDLCGLFVGSEGTLGVITEITLRLRPAPVAAPRTVVGVFDRLTDAGAAATATTTAGVIPSVLELLDRHCLAAVDSWKNMKLDDDVAALLLGRIDTPGSCGADEAATMLQCFRDHGATWAETSTDAREAAALFEIRQLAFPALERLGKIRTEDVCVPRTHLAEMLARVEEIAARRQLQIATIAHAGDGNVHPEIVVPRGDAAAEARAEAAFEEIMDAAIDLGGTVSGEHGIGLLKLDGMERELGSGVSAMQHAVKAAIDPLGIFNPGKAIGDADR